MFHFRYSTPTLVFVRKYSPLAKSWDSPILVLVLSAHTLPIVKKLVRGACEANRFLMMLRTRPEYTLLRPFDLRAGSNFEMSKCYIENRRLPQSNVD